MANKKEYDPKDKFSDDGFTVVYNPNDRKKKEQKPAKQKTKK